MNEEDLVGGIYDFRNSDLFTFSKENKLHNNATRYEITQKGKKHYLVFGEGDNDTYEIVWLDDGKLELEDEMFRIVMTKLP
jgi:hypothetical protein